MKKLGTALCLSSTLLVAANAHAFFTMNGWEGNWLVGASGGYVARDGKLHLTMNHSTGAQTRLDQNLSSSGGIWGLLTGYQARCNGWLVGGEVNVDWWDHGSTRNFAFTDAVNTGWNASANVKRSTNVGLTGRLGYEASPYFLPYIRLGAETSKDKLGFAAVNNAQSAFVNAEGNRRSYRFVGGVGAEVPVPVVTGLSLRLEYNYHSKGKAVHANALASNGLTNVYANTRQHANSGKASIVWNFL